METAASILKELELLGNPATKRILMNHGAREPFFGVRIADLKTIVKRIKKDYALSLALYESGNSDAMYLAGLIADEKKMTKEDLTHWVDGAYWYMLSEYTVPWVCAESAYGYSLGKAWIQHPQERYAAAGWVSLGSLLALGKIAEFEQGELNQLLDYIAKNLHSSQNRVRYCMNTFLIMVGTYVPELRNKAIGIANGLGEVKVDLGSTACKVPEAAAYIQHAAARWNGKFKKTVRC